jgi:hypothetical protein
MGRKKKKPLLAKKQKSNAGTVTPIKKEEQELAKEVWTSAKLSAAINDLIGDKSRGFAYVVTGEDGQILPFCGAQSIGDLLTLKYVLEKEIARVVDSVAYPKKAQAEESTVE